MQRLRRLLTTEAAPGKRSFGRKVFVGIGVAAVGGLGVMQALIGVTDGLTRARAGYVLVKKAFYAYQVEEAPQPATEHAGDESSDVTSEESGNKPRLVVLGSGWGAVSCVRHVDLTKWDVTIVRYVVRTLNAMNFNWVD